MTVYVHPHAIQRFRERVRECSEDEARASILSHLPAIETAVGFGATIVKLGDGSRLVVDGSQVIPTVVTVIGRGMVARGCRRAA